LESTATDEVFQKLQANTGIRIDLAESFANRQPLRVVCDTSADNPRNRMFGFYDFSNFPNQISLSPKFRDCVNGNFTNKELMLFMSVTIARECCHFLMRLNNGNQKTPREFLKTVRCSEFGYFWERIVFDEMQLVDEGLCLNIEKFDGHFWGIFQTFHVEWVYKFGLSFFRSWVPNLSWIEPAIFRPKHWFNGSDLPLNLKLSDQNRTAVLRKSYVTQFVDSETFSPPSIADIEILQCSNLEFRDNHIRVARKLTISEFDHVRRRIDYDAPLEERCRRFVFEN
jgi:hypothetical protein